MPHVTPRHREDLEVLEPVLAASQALMGFVPNSMTTMAHMPQLTVAFSMLAGVVFGGDLQQIMRNYQSVVENPALGRTDPVLTAELVQLIAYSVSLSAGCQYCQAHTSHNANRFGLSEEKLQQVLSYETADVFSSEERALIAIALAAGQVPNETNAQHFEALKEHFDERQIVQIVAVISMFGFLNRWNDTMATELENKPIEFAQSVLAQGGWNVGKHEHAG